MNVLLSKFLLSLAAGRANNFLSRLFQNTTVVSQIEKAYDEALQEFEPNATIEIINKLKYKGSFNKIASSIKGKKIEVLDNDEERFINIFYEKLKVQELAWREIQSQFYQSQGENLRIVNEKVSELSEEITNLMKNNTSEILENIDTQSREIKDGIEKVHQSISNSEENEANKSLKIVEYTNEQDLFRITALNSSSDPKFIQKVELILTNRKPLEFLFTPMNMAPYSNEEVLINLLPGVDKYQISPNIYIPPKCVEILNFKLHRPDAYYGFEIMETVFEIETDDDKICKTEKILDYIGHFKMPLLLAEKFLDENKEKVISTLNNNKKIIQYAIDSNIKKSSRLKKFLESYSQDELELRKYYKL